MKIPFTKMHGAGNDFILVDDRALVFPIHDQAFLRLIASRRTGVGCDGIILLQPSETSDIRMRIINPDGNEVEMCGNGARCIARFAFDRGAAPKAMAIETGAGTVQAEVLGDQVRLELTDPTDLALDMDAELEWKVDFVNTGVPHAVVWVDNVQEIDLLRWGKLLREHALFAPAGTNADFARVEADGSLRMRTYERGVEEETLACGTGAAAVAVLAAERGRVKLPVTVHCAGGFDLVIDCIQGKTTLTGGAATSFEGEMEYGNRV
ncbi:MAG TPA: diaminopimelate epimerase [Pontiella sp.]